MAFDKTPLKPGKIALFVEYDGAKYFGWQRQTKPPVPTVQAMLEDALSQVANHPVTVFCAGRTDARVHGCNQVVHFEANAERSQKAWVCGVNANLPDDIVVHHAQAVADDFHARHSAVARSYRYIIANTATRSANFSKKVTYVPLHEKPLDHDAMHLAAQSLLGENDFSSFRGAGCQSNSPYRHVEYINVTRRGDLLVVEIKANAFVLHMVRNIVGVLIAIGLGQQEPSWAKQVLDYKDRTKGGKTAPAEGLYFVKAHYLDECGLPSLPLGPLFLN